MNRARRSFRLEAPHDDDSTKEAITQGPDLHSGAPVFTGTRIAVTVLLDYLADGQRIDDFLQHYPSVTLRQAVAAIEEVE